MKTITLVFFVEDETDVLDRALDLRYEPDLRFVDDYEGPIPTEQNRAFFVGWAAGKAKVTLEDD